LLGALAIVKGCHSDFDLFQRCDEEDSKGEQQKCSRYQELAGGKPIPKGPKIIELNLKRSRGLVDNLRHRMDDASHYNDGLS